MKEASGLSAYTRSTLQHQCVFCRCVCLLVCFELTKVEACMISCTRMPKDCKQPITCTRMPKDCKQPITCTRRPKDCKQPISCTRMHTDCKQPISCTRMSKDCKQPRKHATTDYAVHPKSARYNSLQVCRWWSIQRLIWLHWDKFLGHTRSTTGSRNRRHSHMTWPTLKYGCNRNACSYGVHANHMTTSMQTRQHYLVYNEWTCACTFYNYCTALPCATGDSVTSSTNKHIGNDNHSLNCSFGKNKQFTLCGEEYILT